MAKAVPADPVLGILLLIPAGVMFVSPLNVRSRTLRKSSREWSMIGWEFGAELGLSSPRVACWFLAVLSVRPHGQNLLSQVVKQSSSLAPSLDFSL